MAQNGQIVVVTEVIRDGPAASANVRPGDTIVAVEQLLSPRGEVVASTVLEKASCARAECIDSKVAPR